jgi:hypothetical protein
MYSNTKFRENPSSGSRIVQRGQRGRHGGTNIRLSQFAIAPNKASRQRPQNTLRILLICYDHKQTANKELQ